MIYEHAQLVLALRDFSEVMPEGDSRVDPMIETMSGLARQAADAIEHARTPFFPSPPNLIRRHRTSRGQR